MGAQRVYEVNLVDEVTQYEFVAAVRGDLRADFCSLLLKRSLRRFPSAIKGFHADNGSEYINYRSGPTTSQATRGGVHQVAPASRPTTTHLVERQERLGGASPSRPRPTSRAVTPP